MFWIATEALGKSEKEACSRVDMDLRGPLAKGWLPY